MNVLERRISTLEAQQTAHPCPDAWHQDRDPLEVRHVDYRQAVAPLMPGYVPPPEERADRCPSCGTERARIAIRAVEVHASLGGSTR